MLFFGIIIGVPMFILTIFSYSEEEYKSFLIFLAIMTACSWMCYYDLTGETTTTVTDFATNDYKKYGIEIDSYRIGIIRQTKIENISPYTISKNRTKYEFIDFAE